MTTISGDKVDRVQLAAAMNELIARQPKPALSDGAPWHLAYLGGTHPALAQRQLKLIGYAETYCPMLRIAKPVPRKRLSRKQRAAPVQLMRSSLRPLVRGYLLVRANVDAPWHDIFRFAGIQGLACEGGRPVRASDKLVQWWRALEQDGAIAGETTIAKMFQLGDAVRVVDVASPWYGFDGSVGALDESGVLRILLSLFGRQTPVEMFSDQLAAATA